MLSSVMDVGFARIMNKHATKGTETRCLQLKQSSKSYCTARCISGVRTENRGNKQPLVLARVSKASYAFLQTVQGLPAGDAEKSGVGSRLS